MKSLYGQYAALYHFSYMSIGAFVPLIGQYLESIGFSGAQIGTITAAGTVSAIFASAFWGSRYSKSRRKHEMLMFLCVMAAVVCFLMRSADVYYLLLAGFAVLYFFQAPIMSLTDAFTVESMQRFGTFRAWGAVGFALGVFFAGVAADAWGIPIIFLFYIISFLIAAFMVLVIKRAKKEKKDDASLRDDHDDFPQKKNAGYLTILRNKRLRRLILCAFFMGGTNVANNTYFSFLYIEGGGTVAGVGAAMLIMVGSEVPFMAWCERLSARFTMEKMIFMAMTVSVIRFLLYGIGLPWWLLMVLAFSQGLVNGILLIEFVRYASHLAPQGYESLAISAYYMIGSNLSTICCQVLGGIILDFAGAHGVYLFFGGFNFIGVCLYLKFDLYREEKNRKKFQKRD